VRLIPWRYGGCVCGIVWLAADATDVAEGAQQRTAAVMYRMMATLQHELRNPLQTMQAAVDILRPEVPLQGQRYLNLLSEHIRLIDAELSDQMLFGVQSQTVFVPGRLSEVVAREIERASLRARTAALRFIHQPAADEPAIELHPGSLGRVFANLFRNAAQARADARVEVAYQVDRHGISCSVSDNGPGFPDLGRSAEGTWLGTGDATGSRLGLAIVASTVEAHGGTVTVGNQVGGGARVLLRLPLTAGHGVPAPAFSAPVQRESPAFALRAR
jgi:signal transduction histidine kinase